MNELAYYLDRYFAELQLEETSAVKGTSFSEDAIRRTREKQEEGHRSTRRWSIFRRLKRKEYHKSMASAGVKV